MGGVEDGTRPMYTSLITINNLSVIVRVIVAGLLRPKSTSSIITTNITYFIFMKHFMKMVIRKNTSIFHAHMGYV